MNNQDNIKQELNELLEENLINNFKIIVSDINKVQFVIITLEDKCLDIETSVNYCYKITNLNEEGCLYETFEQILNKHSEMYCRKFGEIITNRLNKLIQERELEMDD